MSVRDATGLQAGAASVLITPPLGVDMVGFLRRSVPAQEYGRPLEANAVVLDDGQTRIAIVALDVIGTPKEYGRRMRETIAAAAGCEAAAVLVNSSHTHAAPPLPGMAKLGGRVHEFRDEERRWADALIDLAASAAAAAARRLEPARLGAARATVELGVNRRQRTEDGGTILGWNPDEACDRDVAVLRIDARDGRAITTVVAYACHPVVVGPEVAELSSDFVGPLRDRVRTWTGGDCLFLQGCAGNILPLEAFQDHAGPEFAFGDRLALAALQARDRAPVRPVCPRQVPYRSAVPIGVWRLEPEGDEFDRTLRYVERPLDLALQPTPTLDEIRALQRELRDELARLQGEGAPPEAWNPIELHIEWAQGVEARIADGTVESAVSAPLLVLGIGDVAIAAFPCEPFCELGLEYKARAGAAFPIALGYSNDLIGYVPTAREFPFGGYEPSVSQRHFGNPSPFDPNAGATMVEAALHLTEVLVPAAVEA
jgi:neutral ceramidase